jgi:hypothetical protein
MSAKAWLNLIITIVVAAVVLYQLARHPIGFILAVVIVALAGLAAGIIYCLWFHEDAAARLYSLPVSRQWIGLVCRLTSLQPPAPRRPDHSHLLLRTRANFDAAYRSLIRCVHGRDAIIREVLESLEQELSTRFRSRHKRDWPPLGVYLFAGNPGSGRRHLAAELARHIFAQGHAVCVDFNDLDPTIQLGALVGGSGTTGSLAAVARDQPCSTFILENIEAATPKVFEHLVQVWRDGFTLDGETGAKVRLKHCLFILLSSRGADELLEIKQSARGNRAAWLPKAYSRLATILNIKPSLIARLDGKIHFFEDPTSFDQLRVLGMLIAGGLSKHGFKVKPIDHTEYARELDAIPPRSNYEALPEIAERFILRNCAETHPGCAALSFPHQ